MARVVDSYPRWYTPVKWFLPIALGTGTAFLLGLGIIGLLPIPAMLGKVAWLPAVYASLEGAKAVAFISLTLGAVASTIGVITSFFTRATVLFYVNELRGTQAIKAQEFIDEKELALHEALNFRHQIEELEATIQNLAEQNDELKDQLEDTRRSRYLPSQPAKNDGEDRAEIESHSPLNTSQRDLRANQ